jgi:hypothetical protein
MPKLLLKGPDGRFFDLRVLVGYARMDLADWNCMRLEEEDKGQCGGEHQGHIDVSLDSPDHFQGGTLSIWMKKIFAASRPEGKQRPRRRSILKYTHSHERLL